jgi:peptidoglycan-associated lipoprotein
MAVAGLMLFAISACAGRQSTAPTTAPDPSMEQTAAESSETELARRQALEAQRRQEEADRRQFEVERNRFVYEDVFFGKKQYRLDDKARHELEWKADWLMRHPEVNVLIEGHCDEGGTPQDNLALGMRRAGEVQSFFLRKGIARERLSSISYGQERPIATGKTEEMRAKNRRVRTVLIAD